MTQSFPGAHPTVPGAWELETSAADAPPRNLPPLESGMSHPIGDTPDREWERERESAPGPGPAERVASTPVHRYVETEDLDEDDEDDGEPDGAGQSRQVVRREALPLEAEPIRLEDGWQLDLPVRDELVSVEKQVVVREAVTVARVRRRATQRVAGTVRHEELRVDQTDDVDVDVIDTPRPRLRSTRTY